MYFIYNIWFSGKMKFSLRAHWHCPYRACILLFLQPCLSLIPVFINKLSIIDNFSGCLSEKRRVCRHSHSGFGIRAEYRALTWQTSSIHHQKSNIHVTFQPQNINTRLLSHRCAALHCAAPASALQNCICWHCCLITSWRRAFWILINPKKIAVVFW